MNSGDKAFTGSIPEIYDTYLVPLIFDAYAEDLANRICLESHNHILETAAGSGVVPRVLVPRLGMDTRYAVTDLNQPMLDYAADQQGPDSRIVWRQADALDLPFKENTFDVMACQFGVMFYPDRIQGNREAYRVLRRGGRYIFNVWDSIEENLFAEIVTNTVSQFFPADPPRFLARIPHGYNDLHVIRSELDAAGFSRVEFETIEKTSRAPSPRHPAIAYCGGTPLRNEIEDRAADSLDAVIDSCASAIADKCGDGPVAGKIQAHVITAIK